jgi:hypothetical protein
MGRVGCAVAAAALCGLVLGGAPAAADTTTVPASKDAWVWSTLPANNIGATATAEVGRTLPKSGPVLVKRALLEFDVSAVPAEALIIQARIRLYVERTSADPLGLELTLTRLGEGFVEGDNTVGVTWDTQPPT